MANDSSTIVQRLWNYCNVLRDDGVSYGDYVEQLTYLLFLKMADEQVRLLAKEAIIPAGYDWQSLVTKDGDELEIHYRHTLEELGRKPGLLGVIFRKAQNKIQDPAKLRRLVELINGGTWSGMDADVKGDIYEGLLEKNAEDTQSGAGQYFTPRALIHAMVDLMRPEPLKTICDPACGTGGFFLVAHDYISKHYQLDRDQARFLRSWSTSAATSGPRPATNSSTSYSTSSPCSRSTAGRPSCCPTTCCLRAVPGRRYAGSCWRNAMSTPCCVCPPASSTRRGSRPTCYSLTARPTTSHPTPG